MTEPELLEHIVEDAPRSRIIGRFQNEYDPPTADEIDRWFAGTTEFGIETTEIDEILYGEQCRSTDDAR